MAGSGVPLKIALSSYGHTAELKSGAVPIAGIAPAFADIPNMIEAYRRMVRSVEFDISELAPTTYFAARLAGAPYVALPIFVMRRFHHGGLVCRSDAGISKPRDLEGKKVGVRAYSVTSGVWARGILAEEYGVDNDKITWVVDSEEHVASLRLPANVVRAPVGRQLGEMLTRGELHAAFAGLPGMGAAGPASQEPKPGEQALHELFADPEAVEAAWFTRTGIYPVHALIVVKEEILAAHPGLARALFEAFSRAKDRYVERLKAGQGDSADDRRYRALARVVGDPLPYGIKANRHSIETLLAYSHAQGLIPERPPLERLFIDPVA
jgi:4,5-dihydroxyphthalate decarboxylase